MAFEPTNTKVKTSTWVVLGLVFVAILAFVFIAVPNLSKLKENSETAAVYNNNITEGANYINDVQTAYKKLQANQEAVALLDAAMPTTPDIAGALVQIDGIAYKPQKI